MFGKHHRLNKTLLNTDYLFDDQTIDILLGLNTKYDKKRLTIEAAIEARTKKLFNDTDTLSYTYFELSLLYFFSGSRIELAQNQFTQANILNNPNHDYYKKAKEAENYLFPELKLTKTSSTLFSEKPNQPEEQTPPPPRKKRTRKHSR